MSETPSTPEIDPSTARHSATGAPHNDVTFEQMGVTATWRKYAATLTWGKGQCLAILDDGCKVSEPAWQVEMPWGPKVIATWNSVDGNDNCHPVPPGYHGTTVGNPSSINLNGVYGVAYNNFVAHVRCVTVVHLHREGARSIDEEAHSMASGLRWVRDNHVRLGITAVNLSPVDDQKHREPMPTVIDPELRALRELGLWVSAPAANHGFTDGISWPACQPDCFGIGATRPGEHAVYLDRYSNVDLLVSAAATSSSNAYAAASSQILREAIERSGYRWQDDASTLADAMMAIFRRTGRPIHDDETGMDFRELNLLAAVDHVMGESPAHPPVGNG